VIEGIGVVTCVYVNPPIDQFWIIDYRIYDPDGDGQSKQDHMKDVLLNCVYQKELLFWAVLMDRWYASKEMMLLIERRARSTTVRSRMHDFRMAIKAKRDGIIQITFTLFIFGNYMVNFDIDSTCLFTQTTMAIAP